MTDKIVISLYDYTGEALKPWAEAGYHCFAYDIQHDIPHYEQFEGGAVPLEAVLGRVHPENNWKFRIVDPPKEKKS